MRLSVRTWGDGPRTALLVHGFSDDAGTWWRIGPALAERGWTVMAPDLRGHGDSPRAFSYAFADFAGDLVDSLPRGADLALGHSLGAVVLGLAVAGLEPRKSVFVDPPWLRDLPADRLRFPLATRADELPAGWSEADVEADLRSNARLDPTVAQVLSRQLTAGPVQPPAPARQGTAILVPELDPVLPVAAHPELERMGYVVVTQPSVRHVMHRDDPEGFLALLLSQLDEDELVA